jgi:hypothetical protein
MPKTPSHEQPQHTSLSNDLRDLIGAANDGRVKLTDAQERRFPRPKTGRRFTQQTLGNQDKNGRPPLELLPEDGLGEGHLTELGASNVTKIFDDGTNHRFPSVRDIVRITCFFRAREIGGVDAFVGLVRVMVLLLKAEWEEHAAREAGWAVHAHEIGRVLREVTAAERHPAELQLRLEEWVSVLDEHGGLVRRHGLSIVRLRQLAVQMLHMGLHHLPNDGPEARAFAQAAAQEQLCFRDGDTAQQEALVRLKHDWLDLREELGGVLFENEKLRLDREHVRCDWMEKFGALYQKVMELTWHCRLLSLELQAIEGGKDMKELLREEQEKRERELDEIKQSLNLAQRRWQPLVPPGKADPALEVEYHTRVRRALTELKLLCHVDRLQHQSGYEALTEKQRAELARIYREFAPLRLEDLCQSPGTIGYGTPGLDRVTQALALAKALLANAGIDVEVGAIIAGATIDEKLAWLDREVRVLGECVKDADADHAALLDDQQVNGWRGDLATPENDAHRREVFTKRIHDLEEDRGRLSALIAKKPAGKEGDADDYSRAAR